MKIVVGLGNPGSEYENTRHNVGFEVVDAFGEVITNDQAPNHKQMANLNFQYQKRFEAEVCKMGELLLVKPMTYMNDSGRAVGKVMNYYGVKILEDVWVVHDDLDIVMGQYKFHLGKGPKIHGGVNSIEQVLGSEMFWRVRMGVDSRGGRPGDEVVDRGWLQKILRSDDRRIPGRKYVLKKLRGEERELMNKVKNEVVEELVERLGASG